MFKINFDESIPIYLQIMDLIKKEIIRGNFKKGEKLPSVRELAEKLRVNPNTVQKAYQELEREGVIFTLRGTGSFVSEDKNRILRLREDMAYEILKNFIKNMKELDISKGEILDLVSKFLKEESSI